MSVRKAVVAGQFYPGGPDVLKKDIANLIEKNVSKKDARGVILPHAGYVYSARVALSVVSRLKSFKTYVILGPNHTGFGPEISVYDGDIWQTPLGEVRVKKDLAKKLCKNSDVFKLDTSAHQFEHSIEVQLPLFQFTNKDFDFLPIVVGTSNLKILKQAGSILAEAIKDEQSILVVASSDMTHYETQESAKTKDMQAIDAILKLDEGLLMQRIQELDISMCGYGPVIIMLACVKELGAKTAELIKYETSARASGDYSAVVGYAGVMVN